MLPGYIQLDTVVNALIDAHQHASLRSPKYLPVLPHLWRLGGGQSVFLSLSL